jgi:ABC-2 type transport system permease protein
LNFFSILSGHYQVDSLDADGVRLEVYHDPRHSMNVERMLHVMKAALDYDRKNFGPYPYAYARIIEMQDYSAGAQSYPGTIPYNENDGFIMDLRDPKRVDYLSYVTAHELGHQYWFHQVMPADMEGDSILTESLAQYSALMIMKHRYGEEQIRRFLKYEMDNYLQGRRKETAEERPLAVTYGQNYIHYNKASVVMFLLQDRLGEDRVNGMLRELLAKYRFKGPPYARSKDLVDGFVSLARTPAERELVLDQLDRITLYDLKAAAAQVRRLPDGQFETTLSVDAGKYYSDGKGNERPAAFDELVDVGVFSARPGESNFAAADVLSMQRVTMHSGAQQVRLVTAKKPAYAAIDPYITFIDRNSNDNIVVVTDTAR